MNEESITGRLGALEHLVSMALFIGISNFVGDADEPAKCDELIKRLRANLEQDVRSEPPEIQSKALDTGDRVFDDLRKLLLRRSGGSGGASLAEDTEEHSRSVPSNSF